MYKCVRHEFLFHFLIVSDLSSVPLFLPKTVEDQKNKTEIALILVNFCGIQSNSLLEDFDFKTSTYC